MDDLAGVAGSLLGGSAQDAIALGEALVRQGLPTDRIFDFVAMLLRLIDKEAGEEILERVIAEFPVLRGLNS